MCKAINDLGASLGAKIVVVKQARCSDKWSEAADALSKHDMQRAQDEMAGNMERRKRMIPREIQKFLANPLPDMELGMKIAQELRQKIPDMLTWETPRMSVEERRKCHQMNKEAEEKEERKLKRKSSNASERKEGGKAKRKTSRGAGVQRNRRRGKKNG